MATIFDNRYKQVYQRHRKKFLIGTFLAPEIQKLRKSFDQPRASIHFLGIMSAFTRLPSLLGVLVRSRA